MADSLSQSTEDSLATDQSETPVYEEIIEDCESDSYQQETILEEVETVVHLNQSEVETAVHVDQSEAYNVIHLDQSEADTAVHLDPSEANTAVHLNQCKAEVQIEQNEQSDIEVVYDSNELRSGIGDHPSHANNATDASIESDVFKLYAIKCSDTADDIDGNWVNDPNSDISSKECNKIRQQTINSLRCQKRNFSQTNEAASVKKEKDSDLHEKLQQNVPKRLKTMLEAGIKMAVFKEKYPYAKMNESDLRTVRTKILEKIDSAPFGVLLPKILFTALQKGVINILCEDTETVAWLEKTFNNDDKTLEEHILKVAPEDKVPREMTKVLFRTKDIYTEEGSDFLKRLNRYNPELKVLDWEVVERQPVVNNAVTWCFSLSSEQLELVKLNNWIAYTGLDQGKFKILKQQCEVEKIDKTDS